MDCRLWARPQWRATARRLCASAGIGPDTESRRCVGAGNAQAQGSAQARGVGLPWREPGLPQRGRFPRADAVGDHTPKSSSTGLDSGVREPRGPQQLRTTDGVTASGVPPS